MSLWQVPAIVLAVLTWLFSPPSNLADAARREALRRQVMPKATRLLTNQQVEALPQRSAPTVPSDPAAVPADPTDAAAGVATRAALPEVPRKDVGTRDEAWWRAQVATARGALERDQLLADSLQSRINALTADASARDDPAQRQQLYEQRTRALTELQHMKEQIVTDSKAIDAIQEDARKQNVPAGWVR